MKRHTTSDLREPWYIRWDSAEPGARQGVLKHRTKRGYKAPPFVLDVLIGLTAGFPPGCALPRSFSWPEDENAALEQLEYYSQDLGDKLKHWIFGEGGIRLAIDRFTSATNIWRALRAVAQASMNFSENAADLEPEPLRVDVPTTIWIDPSRGYSLISKDPFMQALDELDPPSDILRIRLCEVCGRVFWAGRDDRMTCSGRCGKVRRTRKWRQNYPDKYKLRRSGYEPFEKKKRPNKKRVASPHKH